MKIRLCALVLALFGRSAHCEDPVAAAEAYLNKQFPADQPGAAVIVLKQGQPLLLKGYGLADIATKAPITPDSVFDLASVSKQFTSMAVMQLAERGKLNYDDDVRKWIHELPIFDAAKPIRVRDLLNQSSGLPDYLALYKGGDAAFAKLRNADLPALFQEKKLYFPVGTKFDYSNSNYALLALLVERVSGKTFATWMRESVFQPLSMNDTRVMDDPNIAIPNRTNGYDRPFWRKSFDVSRKDGPVCGDGNVFTTVKDLAKWDAGLSANKLVRADTLNLAFTPAAVPDYHTGKPSKYGFGWVVEEKDGKKMVWHNGGWAGTRTTIYRWLSDGMTIVVLCNSETSDADEAAVKLAKIFRAPPQP